jgi:hypothetical protein
MKKLDKCELGNELGELHGGFGFVVNVLDGV